MQAATTVGELWVTYRIKLSKTRAPLAGLTGGRFCAGSGNVGTLTSGSPIFGSVPIITGDSTYQTDTIGLTTNTITLSGLRPGTVVYTIYAASSTAGSSPTFNGGTVTGTGVTGVVDLFSGGSGFEAGATSSAFLQVRAWQINENPSATPPVITYGNPTITGSGATFKWYLYIFLSPYQTNNAPLLSSTMKSAALLDLYNQYIYRNPTVKVDDDQKQPITTPSLERSPRGWY
jgi:hypothetical protein